MMSAALVQKNNSSIPSGSKAPKRRRGRIKECMSKESGAAYVRPTCAVYVGRPWWMAYVTHNCNSSTLPWLQLQHCSSRSFHWHITRTLPSTNSPLPRFSQWITTIRPTFSICALPLHHPFCFFSTLIPFYFAILQGAPVRPYQPTLSTVYLPSPIVSHSFLSGTINWHTCFPLFSFCTWSSLHALGALAPFSRACGTSLYALAPGLRCCGTSWFRFFAFALADAWVGFVLAMFALVLLLCFTKPRTTEWNWVQAVSLVSSFYFESLWIEIAVVFPRQCLVSSPPIALISLYLAIPEIILF